MWGYEMTEMAGRMKLEQPEWFSSNCMKKLSGASKLTETRYEIVII